VVNEEKQARSYLERKRTRKPGSDKEAARVARMLMRAGFSSGTITRILKRWDVGDAVVSAVEEESGEF
ncbi:hypothetical protein, partial [Bacillus subtilis]|uniref:hypothetical protein n=1 Tax=Bacillus subtilis TaxID=1423 RepID=UPI003C1D36ED